MWADAIVAAILHIDDSLAALRLQIHDEHDHTHSHTSDHDDQSPARPAKINRAFVDRLEGYFGRQYGPVTVDEQTLVFRVDACMVTLRVDTLDVECVDKRVRTLIGNAARRLHLAFRALSTL
eukprot:m.107766 g.107766  ORF g.107766 m.107766 type:complete len:122 (+) comp14254_c1_seq1:2466-2831(+)